MTSTLYWFQFITSFEDGISNYIFSLILLLPWPKIKRRKIIRTWYGSAWIGRADIGHRLDWLLGSLKKLAQLTVIALKVQLANDQVTNQSDPLERLSDINCLLSSKYRFVEKVSNLLTLTHSYVFCSHIAILYIGLFLIWALVVETFLLSKVYSVKHRVMISTARSLTVSSVSVVVVVGHVECRGMGRRIAGIGLLLIRRVQRRHRYGHVGMLHEWWC